MAATLERPLDAYADADDDLVHLVCCIDGDRAFCGEDMTGASWIVLGDDAVLCTTCQQLNQTYSSCPLGKKCPE